MGADVVFVRDARRIPPGYVDAWQRRRDSASAAHVAAAALPVAPLGAQFVEACCACGVALDDRELSRTPFDDGRRCSRCSKVYLDAAFPKRVRR